MSLHVVILAAGQGKRMYSTTPKVLHTLAGKSMLEHVVDTARALNPEMIHVVIGHGGELIKEALPGLPVQWVMQAEQWGTGHAVLQALPAIPTTSQVLVLSADVPLVPAPLLQALIDEALPSPMAPKTPLALLLALVADPTGLGRIVRNERREISAIVEEKDADEEVRQIHEIYSGICCAKAGDLKRWLPKLNNDNAQGEYYLTGIIAMALADHSPIVSIAATDEVDILGVNNRLQLQVLERQWQMRKASALMLSGVSIADASRIDIRGELECGKDVFIDINAVFTGQVVLGDDCVIEANCSLTNVRLGARSHVFANSVLEGCEIAEDCHIGPFARLRPGTALGPHCKIGNFVETKKAVFDAHSKASHLSYLGDVTIGKEVNIGAGTITCNYDGVNKHQTVIEDGVFIGSDTQLVAPVVIGANATIGAGSSIRRNVPAGELTLTESKQKTIYGWRRPRSRD